MAIDNSSGYAAIASFVLKDAILANVVLDLDNDEATSSFAPVVSVVFNKALVALTLEVKVAAPVEAIVKATAGLELAALVKNLI